MGLLDGKVCLITDASRGMRKLGTQEEVADAILFLASDLSRGLSGDVIGVNVRALLRKEKK